MGALLGVRFRTEATPATNSTSLLAEGLTNSETSVDVDDKDDFAVGQNIKVDSEEMTITSMDSLNSQDFLVVVRAVNGTSAATHNDNAVVYEDTSPTYSPSRNPDMDVVESTNYKGISVNEAYGGKIYTNERFGKQLEWELSYTNLSSADRTILETLINVVRGRKTSFYFSPDTGSTFYNVRFTEDNLKFTQTAYNIFSVSFIIRQELS